ncbi:hypothetical protein PGTUg99_025884 [Puccinia graminis f. sp. tritici]|uniref:Uncharacterized protein n=1 Tax=Puccinia graminis f. sp. tritici TaxID=56615 RepID=A0A5B0P4F5_PUCGR|nr:hypothetical protein PGTUg99_025884 [Puccinia graminis f. sp. tritici]
MKEVPSPFYGNLTDLLTINTTCPSQPPNQHLKQPINNPTNIRTLFDLNFDSTHSPAETIPFVPQNKLPDLRNSPDRISYPPQHHPTVRPPSPLD